MRDDQKTKADLLQELNTLRERVSEHKQAAEEWSKIFNATSDIVFIQDKDFKFIKVNKSACDVLKVKPEDLIGKKCYEVLHKSDKPWPNCPMVKALKDKRPHTQEVYDPNIGIPLLITTSPIFDENGELTGVVHIATDITKRKKAEKALKREKERAEQYLDTAEVGITIVNSDENISMINKKGCEILGYKGEELIGKNWFDILVPQRIRSEIRGVFRKLMAGDIKPVEYYENPLLTKDGDERLIAFHNALVIDHDGKVTGTLFSAEDITERKRAEDELKESEERFRTIFDNAPDGLLVATAESKKIYTANKAFCQMLGYNREELENLGIADIHPKKDLPYVIEQFEKQARREFTLSRDLPVERKDGSVFYADINSFPITLAGKSYLMGVFRDITERKKAEEALRESENKYRTLLENLPQKIFLKDKNSVYVSCNDNLARDLKIRSEEIAGKTDYDFLPKKLAEKYRADDKRIIESGKTEAIEEKYIQEGKERIVHTVKTPVKDEQGNTIGVLGIFWDITELKRREEELNIYRENMVRAEELATVGTLSATLAHELSQPLTVIGLSIQNSLAELETVSCPGTVVEDLKEGLSEVSTMTSMVDRFRNFAKMSLKRTVSKVDFKAIAGEIVKLLDESAWRAKVTLQVEGMDKLPLIYSCERDMEQLFFSLIENAIQAADGKKKRRVVISGAVSDDEHIELQFSDNCGGIAPENLDKIFEPFFTTKHADEKTGLGLCVVERIVSQLGGKIRIESKLGKGSTFFVTLPTNRGKR